MFRCRRYKYWFQKQTEAIFNLTKSKMFIVIPLAIYNADKFSELQKKFENYFSSVIEIPKRSPKSSRRP